MTVDAQGRLLLYLPAGFDRNGATRYPLLIFLHGSGGTKQYRALRPGGAGRDAG